MAILLSTICLAFKVRRGRSELVVPAKPKPTPYEFKQLSDIDDQEGLRFLLPIIQFYKHNPNMEGSDPAKVIKEAIAEMLVFYYPFAGKKLFVECTGEGILFIEADVTFEQFGDTPRPPFPCLEELLCDVPNHGGILNCPLLLVQVTRLKCGGFIFALRLNHTMSDASGIAQVMTAVAEIARGASTPSILPVWQRALLNARDPPAPTFPRHEYPKITAGAAAPLADVSHRSFIFGPADISAVRKTLPLHLRRQCSAFDVLWRLRTKALRTNPEQQVRILCPVDARSKFNDPPLPSGYYGNAIAFAAAATTAGELCRNPVAFAADLVRRAKAEVTAEYMKSAADLMAMNGRPGFDVGGGAFVVSDVRRAGFENVDFGWGAAAYGGPAEAGHNGTLGVASFFGTLKNKNGENGIVVPLVLPAAAMERFVVEIGVLLKVEEDGNQKGKSISAL